MCKHHVGPFDLMFNIQFAKMLLAGLALVITGQITLFFKARLSFELPPPPRSPLSPLLTRLHRFLPRPPTLPPARFSGAIFLFLLVECTLVNIEGIIQHVLHDKCMKLVCFVREIATETCYSRLGQVTISTHWRYYLQMPSCSPYCSSHLLSSPRQMVYSTGPVLLLLGLSGAMGQVFIFVTISKFGALTCSIIGEPRCFCCYFNDAVP